MRQLRQRLEALCVRPQCRWLAASSGAEAAHRRRIFGTDEVPPVLQHFVVREAQLEVELDASCLALRRVTFAGETVLEGVGFVLRDEAWGTVPLVSRDGFVQRVCEGKGGAGGGRHTTVLHGEGWADQLHVDVTLTEVGDQVRSPRHRAMRLAAARIDASELSR